jgi:general stress protein 26
MTNSTPSDRETDRKKLRDLIKDIRVAMLTTVDEDGTLRARPMGNHQGDFSDELLFLTYGAAHKAIEVGKDDRVAVAFSDPGSQTYISVSGRATLTTDRAKAEKIWSPWAKVWFPDGLDTPDLAVLSVTIEKAEYWDSPSGTFVLLYGLVTQALTGHPPHLGDNKKIAFG